MYDLRAILKRLKFPTSTTLTTDWIKALRPFNFFLLRLSLTISFYLSKIFNQTGKEENSQR